MQQWLVGFFDKYEILSAVVLWISIVVYLQFQFSRPMDSKKLLEETKKRLTGFGLILNDRDLGLCALFHSNYVISRSRSSLFLYGALASLVVLLLSLLKSYNHFNVEDQHVIGSLLVRAIPSAIALFTIALFLRQHRYFVRVGDFYLSRYHGILLAAVLDDGKNVGQWMQRQYPKIDTGTVRVPSDILSSLTNSTKLTK